MFAELFALDEKIKRRISFILLALLVLIASMPAFAPILKGCDTSFHLYRIIGIAEALSDGVFPVRMQYSQMQGLGFPVSIMYGDIFLYFPALLYKAGLSLTAAYRVFVFVSNCFVVCITYILTKRFANSRIMAFSATTVWTLGTYRLVDLYVRGAAGEYSALAFFPLVAYGLWAAFTLRGKSTTKIAPSIWIAFGMTGIILSHVISVVLVFFALLPLLIVLAICGNRKKKGWLSVLGACGITLGASLWFVIPFLWWYSTQDMWQSLPEVALSVAYVGYNVGTLGQFLQVFPSFAYDYSYPLDYGAYHELPLSLGCGAASLLICALLSLVVKQGIHNKKKSDSSLKTSASRSDCASAGVFATRSDCVGTGVFAGKSAIQGNCAGTC